MLALLFLPALLGIGLIIGLTDDDDEGTEPGPDDINTLTQPNGTDILEGTDGADRLVGNDIGSEMLGFGGNDIILGNGGGDAIDAGAGNDTVFGGAGNDFAAGGSGDDQVFLGDGNDDYLPDEGGEYDSGDDFVRGGAGADLIGDLQGYNELYGDVGNDTLVAFDGLTGFGVYTDPNEIGTTDVLDGGFGNDVLAGDHGDIMSGGQGMDTFITLDDEDPPIEAVTITDFNTDEDELVIGTLYHLADQSSIGLVYDSQLEAVRATYEGRTVAVLEGLRPGDIAGINVSVVPFDDIGNA